ncbi:SDR family oxidoreductase [Virgibacillus oceani]
MGMEKNNGKITPPAQRQHKQPGIESKMFPEPAYLRKSYKGSGKLENKVALITGGDSGIGRAVSIHFAKEGANVAVVYLDEHEDAEETKRLVELEGQQCLLISGDIGHQSFCEVAVTETINKFKKIDILVNNAGEQHPQGSFMDISSEQLEQTFRTNVFSMFYITKAVLPNLKEGSSIINSSSITAYQGSADLIDYSATKGAITSFTRSLSESVAAEGIRVNGVAPGPIWTPLIPASFSKEKVDDFGGNTPMKRPGQPQDLAPAYVYLASEDSSYVSGQMIHVNGGIIVAG